MRADGVPGGGPEALRRRLEQALAVVAALPLADGRPLPDLAAEVTGDPLSLDGTKALPGLVLRALAALRNEPVPRNAQERRALWAACGVYCDAHSSTVLVLGLRPRGTDPLAQTLRIWAEAGQAAVVTLDQISPDRAGVQARSGRVRGGEPLGVGVGAATFGEWMSSTGVCRVGPAVRPWPCCNSWPRRGLSCVTTGISTAKGCVSAAHAMARTGALPWRMGAQDYREALSRVATAPPPGRTTPVPWDGELHEVIAERGVAVHEERVTETLLSDLRAGADAR